MCVCYSSMAGDIQKQREEFERMKRDLQRRTGEVEGELALQRQVNTDTYTHTLHTPLLEPPCLTLSLSKVLNPSLPEAVAP